MDLFDVAKACIRRWYVFLPIVALAVVSPFLVRILVTPSYTSQAMIGLALPAMQPQAADPLPRNGLMDAGGALVIADVIADTLNEPAVEDQVVAAGGKDNYTVKMFPSIQQEQIPLIVVEASEPDPASASKTVELAAAQAGPVTRRMQEAGGVPDDQMVKPVVVSGPTPPVQETKGRLKLSVAVFLIGLALAVLAAVVVDVMLMRRNARDDSRRPASMSARRGADPEDGSATDGEIGSFEEREGFGRAHDGRPMATRTPLSRGPRTVL